MPFKMAALTWDLLVLHDIIPALTPILDSTELIPRAIDDDELAISFLNLVQPHTRPCQMNFPLSKEVAH